MSQLYEFISKYDFRCKFCNRELRKTNPLDTAGAFGIIILVGETDGYIGWSCSSCKNHTTNLTKVDEDPYLFIQLLNENSNSEIDETFMYRSFPYNLSSKNKELSFRKDLITFHTYETRTEFNFYPSFKPPSGKFVTYRYGTDSIGPALSIFWHDLPQIQNLLKHENENGIRVFPRYSKYNWLIREIDQLCWSSRIQFDFLRDLKDVDKKLLYVNPDKSLTIQSYSFLKILDNANSISSRSYSEFDPTYKWFKDAFNSFNFFRNTIIGPRKIEFFQHSDFSIKAWQDFHSNWMQNLLNNLGDAFISDYLHIISKVDCGIELILKTIGSYTEKVYNAIISEYKRKTIKEKAGVISKKRVEEAEKRFPNVKIISEDKYISEIKIKISQLAPIKLADSFLITGEPGTGKDLFARAIHEASNRTGNFIKIDCGSISEKLFESEVFGYTKGAFTGALRDTPGKFSAANNGTIFFDEIGNLPLSHQPKLLRALQDRQYVPVGSNQPKTIDAKFIFATNKNLNKMVAEDLFMPDLYDRFKRPQLSAPPLRERKDDVPLLAAHFIEKYDSPETANKDLSFIRLSKECIDALKRYDWPGNIRELEQVIKEIILNRLVQNDRSEILELDLPDDLFSGCKSGSKTALKIKGKLPGNTRIKDEDIIRCMNEFGNNKTRVAEQLGVTYKTIWLRCKKLGL